MDKICICTDYSETLGARHISDSDYSGEHFRESLLVPRFEAARSKGEKLEVNLDGGYGNPVSFVEEAFGGLARKYGSDAVLETLVFISNDEPDLINQIYGYIRDPETNQVYLNSIRRNRL